jgi:hypothetical protein
LPCALRDLHELFGWNHYERAL